MRADKNIVRGAVASLMACFVTTFSAFADTVTNAWFNEPALPLAPRWTAVTGDVQNVAWEAVASTEGSVINVDAEDGDRLVFTPTNNPSGAQVIYATLNFKAAYASTDELLNDPSAKAGVALVKDGTDTKIAYLLGGAWSISSAVIADANSQINLRISVIPNETSATCKYEYKDGDAWTELGSGAGSVVASAEFLGCGAVHTLTAEVLNEAAVTVNGKAYATLEEALNDVFNDPTFHGTINIDKDCTAGDIQYSAGTVITVDNTEDHNWTITVPDNGTTKFAKDEDGSIMTEGKTTTITGGTLILGGHIFRKTGANGTCMIFSNGELDLSEDLYLGGTRPVKNSLLAVNGVSDNVAELWLGADVEVDQDGHYIKLVDEQGAVRSVNSLTDWEDYIISDAEGYEVVQTYDANAEYKYSYTLALKAAPTVTVDFTSENVTLAVTTNGEPVEVSGTTATVITNAALTVVATPTSEYEYTAASEGWELSGGALTKAFTASDDPTAITVPAPTKKSTPTDPAWFYGKIEAGWPNVDGMKGAWLNSTYATLQLETAITNIEVDTGSEAVKFKADTASSVINGVATIDTTVMFSSMEMKNLGSVLEGAETAKGGLTLVKDDDGKHFYALAKDPNGTTNMWTKIAAFDDFVAEDEYRAVKIEVKTMSGAPKIQYTLAGIQSGFLDIVLPTEDQQINGVAYRGYGNVSVLNGTYEEFAALLDGTEGFGSFDAAYLAATNGATIKLLKDAVMGAGLGPKRVYIDKNDKTLDITAAKSAYYNAGYECYEKDGQLIVKVPFAGEGTEANPWQVANTNMLVLLKNAVNAGSYGTNGEYFIQTAYLDLSGCGAWAGIGCDIGDDTMAFSGTYDGQGYTVDNVTLALGDYVGLFARVADATIKNLTVKIAGMEVNPAYTDRNAAAAVVGYSLQNLTITDVKAQGVTADVEITGEHNVGGVAVVCSQGATFTHCVNEVKLRTSYSKLGGICCYITGGGTFVFDSCTNTAAITADGTYTNLSKGVNTTYNAGDYGVSGILGYEQTQPTLTFKNCYNTGTLSAVNANPELTTSVAKFGSILGRGASKTAAYTGNTGNAAKADVLAVGFLHTNYSVAGMNGLNFATVAGDMATFIADSALAAGSTYKVMAPITTKAVTLAADQTIAFDCALNTAFEAAITVPAGYHAEVTTNENVKTYAAVADKSTLRFENLADAHIASVKVEQPQGTVLTPVATDTYTILSNAQYFVTYTAAAGYAFEGGATTKTVTGTATAAEITINPQSGDIPVVVEYFTISFTKNAYSTYTVTTGEAVAVTITADAVSLPSNTAYTVKASPKSGYEYTTAPQEWSQSGTDLVYEGIAEAAATVVIPVPTEIQSTGWFDGKINSDWPTAEGMNGAWSDNAAALATFDTDHIDLATKDDKLAFTPTEEGALNGSLVTIASQIKFAAMEVGDLPYGAEIDELKCGLALIDNGNQTYSFYGIVRGDNNASTNMWLDLGITGTADAYADVTNILQLVNGEGRITYVINGEEAGPYSMKAGVSDKVTEVAYKGSGAVKTLVGAKEVTGEAMYGDQVYNTFGEAFAAATNNATIKLLKSVTWDGAGALLKNVFIDENGKIFDASAAIAAYAEKGFKCTYRDGKLVTEMPFVGAGTEASPWQIATYDDLVLFKNGVNAGSYGTNGEYFVQTDNIDFTGKEAWAGIGTCVKGKAAQSYGFAANYDGQGHTISNVKFTARKYAGLFNQLGNVSRDAIVKNLTLENFGFEDAATGEFGGAFLAGALQRGKVSCILTKGTFGTAQKSLGHNAAGILVRINAGTIESCTNAAAIYGVDKIAGIVSVSERDTNGYEGAVKLTGCVNSGALTCSGTAGADGVAGMVAYCALAGTEISGCVNTGVITSTVEGAALGQIAGKLSANNVITSTVANVVLPGQFTIGSGISYGFNFATVEDGKATLVKAELQPNTTNRAMTKITKLQYEVPLAKDEWIAFDNALSPTFSAEGKIVAEDTATCKIKSATVGTVTTFTCAEIKWAQITLAVDDGVANVAFTNVETGVEFPAPYKADVDSNITVSVNYTLKSGYKLKEGCVPPQTITLTQDYTLAITTTVDTVSIEGKITEVEGATWKAYEIDGAKTNDVTSTLKVHSGKTLLIVYTAEPNYQLTSPSEFTFENLKSASEITYTAPKALNEYNLVYRPGADATGAWVTNAGCVYGTEYPAIAVPVDFAKQGYLFECWTNTVDGSTYLPGEMVSNLTTVAGGEAFLEAAWTGNWHKVTMSAATLNSPKVVVSNATVGVVIEKDTYSGTMGGVSYTVLDGTHVVIYYYPAAAGDVLVGDAVEDLGNVTSDVSAQKVPLSLKLCKIEVYVDDESTYVVSNHTEQIYFKNNETNMLEGTFFQLTATPLEGRVYDDTTGWDVIGRSIVTNVVVGTSDITIEVPDVSFTNYVFTVPVGEHVSVVVSNKTTKSFIEAEGGKYEATYNDRVVASYTADDGWTLVNGDDQHNTIKTGVEFTEVTATATVYTITYKDDKGADFEAWASDYTATNSYTVTNVVYFPTAANIDGTKFENFLAWTNAEGVTYNASTEAYTNDLTLIASATPAFTLTVEITNTLSCVVSNMTTGATKAMTAGNNTWTVLKGHTVRMFWTPTEGYKFSDPEQGSVYYEDYYADKNYTAEVQYLPGTELVDIDFTVPVGENVTALVTNLTAGGAAMVTNELGKYTATYFDYVKASYSAPKGYALVNGDDQVNQATNGVKFVEVTATAIDYTIAYKNGDGSEFDAWKDGFEVPVKFAVTNEVTLPVAANVNEENFLFNAWTNASGVIATTAGIFDNLTVYADVTKLWSVKKPTVANAECTVYTNGTVKVEDGKKVADGAEVKFVFTPAESYVLEGQTEFTTTASADDVTVDVGTLVARKLVEYTFDYANAAIAVMTNGNKRVTLVDDKATLIEANNLMIQLRPNKGYAFGGVAGWTAEGTIITTNGVVLATDQTLVLPRPALTNYVFEVPVGENVTALVTNLTAGGAAMVTNEFGKYEATYFDYVKASYSAPKGYALVNGDDQVNQITNGVKFTEVTATAIDYTIAYKNGDGSEFDAWKDGFEVPVKFAVTNEVTLPVAANVNEENFLFNAWTNENGVIATTAGIFDNLTVYADVTKLWSVKKPTVANAECTVYTNDTIKVDDGKKVVDGAEVKFVFTPASGYVLEGQTEFTTTASANDVTVDVGKLVARKLVEYTFDYTNATIAVMTNSTSVGGIGVVTLVNDKATLIEANKIYIGLAPEEGYAFGDVAGWQTLTIGAISSNGVVLATDQTLVMPRPALTNYVFEVPIGENVNVVVSNETTGAVLSEVAAGKYKATYFDVVRARYTADEGFTLIGGEDQVNQITNGVKFTEVTVKGNDYKVAYYPGAGADGTAFTNNAQYNVAFQVADKGTDFAKTGYTFAGAWTNDTKRGGYYVVDQTVSNLTTIGIYDMTALWKANKFEVHYISGIDGVADYVTTNTYDVEAMAAGDSIFQKPGYTYESWTNSEGTVYQVGKSIKNISTGANVKLYAAWTPNYYTLAYDPGKGEGSKKYVEDLVYDQVYTVFGTNETQFTKKGYTFVNWTNTTKGAVAPFTYEAGAAFSNLTTEAYGKATFEATWKANEYKVHYTDGDDVAEDGVTYDEEYTILDNEFFEKTGYTFADWTNETDNVVYQPGKVVSNLTTVAGGTYVLKTIWKANKYEVKYVANGGEGEDLYTTNTYDKNFEVPGADVFTKTGYAYDSWTNANGDVYAVGATTNNLSTGASVTLYAAWTPNDYALTYKPGKGDGTEVVSNLVYDQVYTAIENPNFTKTGYTFVNWTNTTEGAVAPFTYAAGAAFSNLTAVAGGEATFEATWKANEYIVFYTDGAESGEDTVTYDAAYTIWDNLFEKPGYTFAGWTNEVDNVVYQPGEVVSNLTAEAGGRYVLKTIWTLDEHTITYKLGDGEFTEWAAGYEAPTAFSAEVPADIPTVANVVQTNYAFYGWTTNGVDFTAATTAGIYTNLTLQAKVTKLYTITAAAIDNAGCKIETNGTAAVAGPDGIYRALEGSTVTITYTANKGYKFADGSTEITKTFPNVTSAVEVKVDDILPSLKYFTVTMANGGVYENVKTTVTTNENPAVGAQGAYEVFSNDTFKVAYEAQDGYELVGGINPNEFVVTNDASIAIEDVPVAWKLFNITMPEIPAGLNYVVTNEFRGVIVETNGYIAAGEKYTVRSNSYTRITYTLAAGYRWADESTETEKILEIKEIASDYTVTEVPEVVAMKLLSIAKDANLTVTVTNVTDGVELALADQDESYLYYTVEAGNEYKVNFAPVEGYQIASGSSELTFTITDNKTIETSELPKAKPIVVQYTINGGAVQETWNAAIVCNSLNTRATNTWAKFLKPSEEIEGLPTAPTFIYSWTSQTATFSSFTTNAGTNVNYAVEADGLGIRYPGGALVGNTSYAITGDVTVASSLRTRGCELYVKGDLTLNKQFEVGSIDSMGSATGTVVTVDGQCHYKEEDGEFYIHPGNTLIAKQGNVGSHAYTQEGYAVVSSGPDIDGFWTYTTTYGGLIVYTDPDGNEYLLDRNEAATMIALAIEETKESGEVVTFIFNAETKINGRRYYPGTVLYVSGKDVLVETNGASYDIKGDIEEQTFEQLCGGGWVTVTCSNIYGGDTSDENYTTILDLTGADTVGITKALTVGAHTNDAYQGAAELWLPADVKLYSSGIVTLTEYGKVFCPVKMNMTKMASSNPAMEVVERYDYYTEMYFYSLRVKGSKDVVGSKKTTIEAANNIAADYITSNCYVTTSNKAANEYLDQNGLRGEFQALFKCTWKASTTPGQYTVIAAFTDAAKEEINGALTNAAATIVNDFRTKMSGKVKVTTKPGLYYGVAEGDTPAKAAKATPTKWVLGTGGEVQLEYSPNDNKFFEIKAVVK